MYYMPNGTPRAAFPTNVNYDLALQHKTIKCPRAHSNAQGQYFCGYLFCLYLYRLGVLLAVGLAENSVYLAYQRNNIFDGLIYGL